MIQTAQPHRELIRKWVAGGEYVVGVDVEVEYPVDAPQTPCFRPATVRFLENVAKLARAGNVSDLEKLGIVYRRLQSAPDELPSAVAAD